MEPKIVIPEDIWKEEIWPSFRHEHFWMKMTCDQIRHGEVACCVQFFQKIYHGKYSRIYTLEKWVSMNSNMLKRGEEQNQWRQRTMNPCCRFHSEDGANFFKLFTNRGIASQRMKYLIKIMMYYCGGMMSRKGFLRALRRRDYVELFKPVTSKKNEEAKSSLILPPEIWRREILPYLRLVEDPFMDDENEDRNILIEDHCFDAQFVWNVSFNPEIRKKSNKYIIIEDSTQKCSLALGSYYEGLLNDKITQKCEIIFKRLLIRGLGEYAGADTQISDESEENISENSESGEESEENTSEDPGAISD